MAMTSRRVLILIAACWHLVLTAVVLPVHLLSHTSDTHCCGTHVAQIDDLQSTQAAQHHPGDCQLCKLDSQLQPAEVRSSSPAIDVTTSTAYSITSFRIVSVFSEHFSGRAPPADSMTTIVVG